MFCALSVVEPGVNWKNQKLRWSMDVDEVPGWALTGLWLTEEGMPVRAIVNLEYFSGAGIGLDDCAPDVNFRKSLCYEVCTCSVCFTNVVRCCDGRFVPADVLQRGGSRT